MKHILDERFILNEDIDLNILSEQSGIYCIIFEAVDRTGNPFQKKYVGQAINIKRRLSDHRKAARPGGRDYLVYNAMRKYPYEVIVLESCPQEKLSEREIYWIRQLHTYVNDIHSKTGKIIKKEFNNKTYSLVCNGPGYNLTQGGEGTVYYTEEIIEELLEIYKKHNYNHTKTLLEFRELHANDIHLNTLCGDTLRLIVEANNLPWQNEQKKTTIIYAQTTVPDPADAKKLRYKPNTSDTKYRKACDSQEEADELIKLVSNKLQVDLGDVLNTIKQKNANGKKGTAQAWCIQYLIDYNLYDKYLDLTQYDLSNAQLEVRPRGRKITKNPVIHDSCWGALASYFNVNKDFKVDN